MSSNPDYPVADAAEDLPADDAPAYGTLPRRRVRAADEQPEIDDSIHTEPAETDPYAYEYEDAPAPRGSMVPILISVVAAVVVIGLMAAIMLTPFHQGYFGTPALPTGSFLKAISQARRSGAVEKMGKRDRGR